MIFYQTIRLTFATIGQVFRVLFYFLVTFLMVFGCMFTFAGSYFSILVQTRFFDNLLAVVKGLFVNLDLNVVVTGVEGLGHSLNDYFEILRTNGFMIEILIGVLLTVLLLFLIFWYRYGINRSLYSYADTTKKSSAYKEMLKKPKESIKQLFLSVILCSIFDIATIIILLGAAKNLVLTGLPSIVQYLVFFLVVMIFSTFRIILFNGWEYVQVATEETATKSYIITFKKNTQNFFYQLFNAFCISAICWVLMIICGQILVGFLMIVGISLAYLILKCYGAVTYHYYTSKDLYIFGKKVNFKKRNSSAINY